MKNFYLTFPQKYCNKRHPTLGYGAHPNGYFVVKASCREEARAKVVNKIGLNFSNLYTSKEFNPDYFPLNKLGEIK